MDRDPDGDNWFYPRISLFRYLVYAQELLPGRIGMVSGLFFGFAFGMGGLGAAVLGLLADHTSIDLVYKICAFLPLLGILTIFLPNNHQKPEYLAAKVKVWPPQLSHQHYAAMTCRHFPVCAFVAVIPIFANFNNYS